MPAKSSQPDLDDLECQLDGAMTRDQRRLRSRLSAARKRLRTGKPADRSISQIATDLDRSIAQRQVRTASIPALHYPDDLPVAQHKVEIAEAISNNQVVVICGETGSGKTTQLPKICLELGRGAAGLIGHTQPRRIAARSVAARISHELGSSLGSHVGYKIRFADKSRDSTLVKLMTDGILLAETQGDRLLEQYDTIIIDEAHERSLNIDFLLGYLKQLLPKRPDLKVIITSATIDPERFAEHFAGESGEPAPIVSVSGRTYQVETRYRPIETEDDPDEDSPEMQQAILDAVDELAQTQSGDILIFLSGEREIRATSESLKKHHPPSTEILPLFARLSTEGQNKIFAPHRGRRIVLATNVAETSLTVPGITSVIDPGYARISRYSVRKKVQGLPIESVSQASANQRKGRCGRIASGVCIRLYSRESFDDRHEFTQPEILRTNLASVILQMKSLKLGAIDRFPFLEKPSDRAIADGYETLYEIGALDGIDPESKLTEIGCQLVKLPIDPRIGRMVIAAADEGVLAEALIIASALSAQDPRIRPFDHQDEADAAHEKFILEGAEQSDFMSYLSIWDDYHKQAKHLSHNKLRKWCKAQFLSAVRMREWIDVHRQLRKLCVELDLGPIRRSTLKIEEPKPELHHHKAKPDEQHATDSIRHPLYAPIHRALLTGLISNIGVIGDRYEYAGSRGLRFSIFPGSQLFRETPKWVMSAELVRTTRLYARTVARVQPKWIEHAADHLVKRTWTEPHWNERTAQVWGYERVTLFGLELVPRRHRHYGPQNPDAARQIFIQRGLVDGLFWTTARFSKHNKDLIEHVEDIQARTRRHDLLASVEAQFSFYDARVPPGIYTGKSFDEWIRREQRRSPDTLCMTESDLMPEGAASLDEQAYPPEVDLAGEKIPVEYHFEPGSTNDGVTLVVPIDVLPQLPVQRMEWLVPGLIEEKIEQLIRHLPKEMRRQLGPAADLASKCAARMEFAKGSLLGELASELRSMSGIEITPQSFDAKHVSDHLQMNVRVAGQARDGRPEVLAEQRDLEQLRRDLCSEIDHAQLAAPDSVWSRRGLRDWDFGDLPESVQLDGDGASRTAYPALIPSPSDTGAADLRLFASQEQACLAHRLGLRRLFVAHAGDQIRFLVRNLPEWDSLALHYGAIGATADLETGLATLTAERAFLADTTDVRTKMQFEARLDTGWHRLGQSADEIIALAGGIFSEHQQLALALDHHWPDTHRFACASIRHQVDHLVSPRFLESTPLQNLANYPRYLKGARLRLEKLGARGEQRDAQLQVLANRYWDRYATRAAQLRTGEPAAVKLDQFRWLVEEFRISLYAQELGTSQPVSEKRLDIAWLEAINQAG